MAGGGAGRRGRPCRRPAASTDNPAATARGARARAGALGGVGRRGAAVARLFVTLDGYVRSLYVFGLLSFFPSPVFFASAGWRTGTAGVSPPSPLWGMMEPSSFPLSDAWRMPVRCQTVGGATVRRPGAGCHTSRPRAQLGGCGAAVFGALHGAYVCACGGGFPPSGPVRGCYARLDGAVFAPSFGTRLLYRCCCGPVVTGDVSPPACPLLLKAGLGVDSRRVWASVRPRRA